MDRLVNINRSRVYEQIVQQVCDKKKYDESGKTLFPTIREFLSFCALLGFSQDKRLPLDKSQGVEDIAGAQYINNEAEEIVYLIATLSEKKPLGFLCCVKGTNLWQMMYQINRL